MEPAGLQERVTRIVQKLADVRDKGLSCIGSEAHKFALHKPAKESDVGAFETAHGVVLPAGYRMFLLKVGDGGAGPFEGLCPLKDCALYGHGLADPLPSDYLARPCPLQPGTNKVPDKITLGDDSLPFAGAMRIGTQGGTQEMLLIVSGEHRGRVVYVNADRGSAYVVRTPFFLAWYEQWLDEILAGYDMSWFGVGPSGGESDFEQIFASPDATDEEKCEAAAAFARLPSLSAPMARMLSTMASHSLPGVRAGALYSMKKHAAWPIDGAGASAWLHDPEPAVRRAGVSAMMKWDAGRWAKDVHAMLLKETASEPATKAYRCLEEAGALTKADRLALLANHGVAGVRQAAAEAIEWTADDIETLVSNLADSEWQVRRVSANQLAKLGAKPRVPKLIEQLDRESDENVVTALLRAVSALGGADAEKALLRSTTAKDDFHRLEAIDGLCKLGAESVLPVAKSLLNESAKPWNAAHTTSGAQSIGELVAKSLRASPNPVVKALATPSAAGGLAVKERGSSRPSAIEPIRLEYEWTERVAWSYLNRIRPAYKYWFLTVFVVGALLTIFGVSHPEIQPSFPIANVVGASAMVVALALLVYFYFAMRAEAQSETTIRWEINEIELKNEIDDFVMQFEWKILSEVREERDCFLFYRGSKIADWIPKQAFESADDLNRFRKLVKANVPRRRN